MHSLTCMSVVVCVVRKPRPCNSYSRRRDRINSVQTHLVVPRKHYFLNIFGIPCFSDVFWQSVFFPSPMHDVPSNSAMGDTHVWEMWDVGCSVRISWHEHVQM